MRSFVLVGMAICYVFPVTAWTENPSFPTVADAPAFCLRPSSPDPRCWDRGLKANTGLISVSPQPVPTLSLGPNESKSETPNEMPLLFRKAIEIATEFHSYLNKPIKVFDYSSPQRAEEVRTIKEAIQDCRGLSSESLRESCFSTVSDIIRGYAKIENSKLHWADESKSDPLTFITWLCAYNANDPNVYAACMYGQTFFLFSSLGKFQEFTKSGTEQKKQFCQYAKTHNLIREENYRLQDELCGKDVFPKPVEAAASCPNPSALTANGIILDNNELPLALCLLFSRDEKAQQQASNYFTLHPDPVAVKDLHHYLLDFPAKNYSVAESIIETLIEWNDPELLTVLKQMLYDREKRGSKSLAIYGFIKLGDPQGIPLLKEFQTTRIEEDKGAKGAIVTLESPEIEKRKYQPRHLKELLRFEKWESFVSLKEFLGMSIDETKKRFPSSDCNSLDTGSCGSCTPLDYEYYGSRFIFKKVAESDPCRIVEVEISFPSASNTSSEPRFPTRESLTKALGEPTKLKEFNSFCGYDNGSAWKTPQGFWIIRTSGGEGPAIYGAVSDEELNRKRKITENLDKLHELYVPAEQRLRAQFWKNALASLKGNAATILAAIRKQDNGRSFDVEFFKKWLPQVYKLNSPSEKACLLGLLDGHAPIGFDDASHVQEFEAIGLSYKNVGDYGWQYTNALARAAIKIAPDSACAKFLKLTATYGHNQDILVITDPYSEITNSPQIDSNLKQLAILYHARHLGEKPEAETSSFVKKLQEQAKGGDLKNWAAIALETLRLGSPIKQHDCDPD